MWNSTRSVVSRCLKCSRCFSLKPSPATVGPTPYETAVERARKEPEQFWGDAAESLVWFKKFNKVLDDSNSPFTKWYPGGELNVCYNAVDRHVEGGKGDKVALIHDSPVTNQIHKVTYKELLAEVSRLAHVLVDMGVRKGDRVIIYMPMISASVVAMLACARIGAIHSLVFGGFSARELAVRMSHAQADVILSANFGIEPKGIVPYKKILDDAIQLSTYKPRKCIIYMRQELPDVSLTTGRDEIWQDLVEKAQPHGCVSVESMDPLYILYTSGTTGLPKAVVRPSGGHAVSVSWSMYNVFGMRGDDVWWAASDLGWVVGHSYICYGPLLNGLTSLLYEGKPVGTPDASSFFRVIEQHKVCGMFTAPTALRIIRKEDPDGNFARKYPMKNLRYMFVAGEHCDQYTLEWTKKIFKVPALDNWWQTETGSPITASCVGLGDPLDAPPGMSGFPVPGWQVCVLNDDVGQANYGELGNIAVKLPLPPGAFSTLYKNDETFENTYYKKFPGYYDTMDSGVAFENGYVSVLSRNDDVINVAGHRISVSAIEEAIMKHNAIAECAVVGVPDDIKGEVPLALFVVKQGVDTLYF